MQAVIPAAGAGTRVAALTREAPKSLIEINGRQLIEHIILAARTAGVRDFVIVTGYQPDAIPAALGNGRDLGVAIEYCHNPRWQDLANGYSILSAAPLLGETFIILMSDHLFEPTLLETLLASPPPAGGCRLLTDPRISEVFDLDDATKVRSDNRGKILEMGKNLSTYDRLDTGLFHSTKGLIDSLRSGIEKGESSLTFGNNTLATKGLMQAVDLRGGAWLDVDTPESIAKAAEFPGL
jgi:1L-myo-inositol 1-phosphate cytidylyltransferase